MNLPSSVWLSAWRCYTMITIVYARQLARFLVAPIFMIWSFAWGSAWTRWLYVSTGLSTHIFLDDVCDSFGSQLCVDAKQIVIHAETCTLSERRLWPSEVSGLQWLNWTQSSVSWIGYRASA
jgi:predicted anti-sigma-YlaC factor YlaD